MRILHILWQGHIGGAERAVYQLVQSQIRHKYQIGVAFGTSEGPYVEKISETGVEIIDLSVKSGHDIFTISRLSKLLTEYDVHHFHVAEPVIMLGSILTPGVMRVYTYRHGINQPMGKKIIRYGLVRVLLKEYFNGISANTMHGARSAEKLFHLPAGSVAVTYNGINFDLLNPQCSREEARLAIFQNSEDEFIIGTISNLQALKRIDWLLRAAAALPIRNWRLLIIGDGQERHSLEMLAEQLSIKEQTIFTRHQSHIPDWLVALDAFVLPSNQGESFGNAAVEAMALGIPTIICSDGGGLLEHVEHDKTGWIANGIHGITDCLMQIHGDRSTAQQIAQAGRQAVHQKYSIENMNTTYNEFYRSAGINFPTEATNKG